MFYIYLTENPIVCGCKFRQTLLILDPAVKFEGSCRYPLSLRGKQFSEIVSNCTKTEEDVDVDVEDAFSDEEIDGNDDLCDAEHQNKNTEDNNNESQVRSAGYVIIGGSIRDITFRLMMTFIIVY